MSQGSRYLWDDAFRAAQQDGAFNTVPPESIVRNVSYYLRSRYLPDEYKELSALDLGCGAGATVAWFRKKGLWATGVDISPEAVELAEERLRLESFPEGHPVAEVWQGDITKQPFSSWPGGDGEHFDIIVTANVLQHLDRRGRASAFAEITRLLNPGGLAYCYEMHVGSSAYTENRQLALTDDPGTLVFPKEEKGYHLEGMGLTHFFEEGEFRTGLASFREVDCSLLSYRIPREEAERRQCGRDWVFVSCYAVK